MPEFIRRRLVYFTTGEATEGGRISDFVAVRTRRAGRFRRIMRVCFVIEAACAVGAVIAAIFCSAGVTAFSVVSSVLFAAAALLAFGGGNIHRVAAYFAALVLAVIYFVMSAAVCGVFALVAAAAAFVTMIVGWFREYLLEYSPRNLTKADYLYTGALLREEAPPPPPPPAPSKSELEDVAEKFRIVMNGTKP